MASVSTEGGSSGNKMDVDLNLVPFIDLLSTLVLFLLLTVVWVQIAAIPAAVDSKGKSTVTQTEQSKVLVHLTSAGYQITWPASLGSQSLPRSAKSLDQLLPTFTSIAKTGKAPPAAVSGDDSVDYGAVVEALDVLKSAGFTMVALSTE